MRPEFFIIASILGWGIGSYVSKLANNVMHPIMISTVVLLTDVPLLILGFVFLKFDKTVTPMGAFYSALVGILMTVGTLGFSYALKAGGDVGKTSVVTALYPAVTLLMSMAFLKETLSIKQGVGIILALISVALLAIK